MPLFVPGLRNSARPMMDAVTVRPMNEGQMEMGHEEQRGSLGVILYSVPVKKGWSRAIAVLKGAACAASGHSRPLISVCVARIFGRN